MVLYPIHGQLRGQFHEPNLDENVLISVAPQPGTAARPTAQASRRPFIQFANNHGQFGRGNENRSQHGGPASRAGVLVSLEPLVGTLLGVVVLKESRGYSRTHLISAMQFSYRPE